MRGLQLAGIERVQAALRLAGYFQMNQKPADFDSQWKDIMMNPETKKKLVELGFTEDKPDHFTLSRCGYTFNVYVKPEQSHTIWMSIPYGDGYSVGWPLADHPEAVDECIECIRRLECQREEIEAD